MKESLFFGYVEEFDLNGKMISHTPWHNLVDTRMLHICEYFKAVTLNYEEDSELGDLMTSFKTLNDAHNLFLYGDSGYCKSSEKLDLTSVEMMGKLSVLLTRIVGRVVEILTPNAVR